MSPARGFSTQALASKARDDFEDALIKPHAQWAVEEERRLWSGRSNKATAARIAAERQKWAWRLGLGMLGAAIIGYILGAFAL